MSAVVECWPMQSSNVCWPVPESMQLSRHALVWVRPKNFEAVAAQIDDIETRAQVAAWLAADRPLVVARQPCSLTDTVAVGLALPPALGKHRIALVMAACDIARSTPPLQLAVTIVHAPAEWQTALAGLDEAATDIGLELCVFGSLAWQALSGLQYVTPQSDIDLLWHPQSRAQLQQGMEMLIGWEQSSGLRADGEVLFGGGSAVSWREWSATKTGDEQRVLVKRESSAELVDCRELLEMLA
jgi:phosphoribosyl-dephospho-CoA transferase